MKTDNKWTITPDLFLTASQVQNLFIALKDAKDLAVHRQKHFVHVRDFFILHTLLESGLRVSELADLKVGDFCEKSLIVRNGKGNKRRTVLLTKTAKCMLQDFIKAKKKILKEPIDPDSYLFLSERRKPYTTRGIRKRVKYWFGKCGLADHLSCHSCRHSYISHMIGAGVDLQTIRANVGHASLSTLSLYAHATKGELEIEIYE